MNEWDIYATAREVIESLHRCTPLEQDLILHAAMGIVQHNAIMASIVDPEADAAEGKEVV